MKWLNSWTKKRKSGNRNEVKDKIQEIIEIKLAKDTLCKSLVLKNVLKLPKFQGIQKVSFIRRKKRSMR